ncbi:MAG: hypothetical protein A2845_03375 [Candidatus Lloydbacteria bacterium RIFCSPHIGHO2_01_FULL_49_22]|uniref:TOD1/MUCI70 glycosyltransferase-like domain-containing protein n=1 Tax=Candidatus Lloydbacteria bacterium RIFCSPHIGHO2_01_FULL_49_22 TaxID=1798658 RepID=A0A1G2CWN3_9BACT|nr:MAG: hypothetical protein A2845_03375 [Candidatus Lloydbacteria bacterium RIFCSPHIGHO2_01_FULL_49_22]OGZ08972.1 MAG: hypothetical protein A3C14_03210 [Candidatus Lloydbacteria bacterium RIFCSPHIGHO2_02_FULL_50_18]
MEQHNPIKKRIVVYTAIFGPVDHLQEPLVIPADCDFVCLTDQSFRSKVWQVRRIASPLPGDFQRSNRFCKLFPHKFFPEYEYSIYVDGNMIIHGDVSVLIKSSLKSANIAFFDHAQIKNSPIDCIYDEAELIYKLALKGRHKDDPVIVRAQMERFHKEGYPEHNGLISGMVVLRRHNEPDVIRAMEAWWGCLTTMSRRDQLSFNYVAWKLGLRVAYLPGDSTDNPYFFRAAHRLSLSRRIRAHALAVKKRLMSVL